MKIRNQNHPAALLREQIRQVTLRWNQNLSARPEDKITWELEALVNAIANLIYHLGKHDKQDQFVDIITKELKTCVEARRKLRKVETTKEEFYRPSPITPQYFQQDKEESKER